jgi:adenine-specific DNA-methyltransferase
VNSIEKFQELLEEIFQFEAADLDFGIYRILNFKRDQIRKFIHEDLKETVESAFTKQKDERLINIAERLEEAKQKVTQTLGAGAILASGALKDEFRDTPVGREYLTVKAQKEEAETIDEIKLQVFNDIYSFFSRYYEEGDFVPQYRYSIKNHKYAIPYNGEEVKLYWANSDQYYTKTGILFRDYAFFTDVTKAYKVVFRTVAAKEELGSNKATKARFFVLHHEIPWEMEDISTLVIRFQYRELSAEEVKRYGVEGGSNTAKQEKINGAICDTVVKGIKDVGLEKHLLLYQLSRFSAKNSRDYFIHKNLKGFLSEQLDYFIKAEVISLETLEKERFFDKHITRAKVVREIGEKIIDFLAQIEDFQKRLWEKKKFVIRTEYVITSDLVPQEFYQEILTSKAQLKEWKELGCEVIKSVKELKEKKLPVDTKHFGEEFKERLLEKLTETADLDDLLDGLVIKSENWQGLNLLTERYRGQLKCIHIDPPYNTQTSGFLYKNTYEHSSWLAMMENRIRAGIATMSPDGAFLCHIDENEYEVLHMLFTYLGIPDGGTIIWDKKNPMLGRQGVATQHEYILWRTWRDLPIYLRPKNVRRILGQTTLLIQKHGGVNDEARKKFSQWISSCEGLTGGERAYRLLNDDGRVFRGVAMGAPEPREDPKFHIPLIHPITKKACPVPPNGWSRTPETFRELMDNDEIMFGENETVQPQKKIFLTMESRRQFPSVLQDAKSGKAFMDDLGLSFPYCHPVSLYEELLGAAAQGDTDTVLDFFAGSGTTDHAVINLNREDGGHRKYILIEMANNFDTVLLPRIKKVVYSDDWKNGKLQNSNGISHFMKYQYLEQYEDALDNIEVKPHGAAQTLFGDDYLLKYFLDFETRDAPSFLSIDSLKKPFTYKLKVNMEEAGEPQEMTVDIPETFNYLLGLRVCKVKARKHKGRTYRFILGEKEGRNITVVWREYDDTWTKADFTDDKAFIVGELKSWAPAVVYINGQSVLTPQLGNNTVEIRQIEPEFKTLMLSQNLNK